MKPAQSARVLRPLRIGASGALPRRGGSTPLGSWFIRQE